MRKVCISFALGLFLSTIVDAQSSGTQHWRSKNLIEKIVKINSYDDKLGNWRTLGTGVLVDIDSTLPIAFIITNRHVLFGKDSVQLTLKTYFTKTNPESRDSTWFVQSITSIVTRQFGNFRYPSTEDSDFAFITVNKSDYTHLKPFRRENCTDPGALEYGQDLMFVGYPNFDSWLFSTSQFQFPILRSASLAYFFEEGTPILEEGRIKKALSNMFLLDGMSIGGNSGGPVVLRNGISAGNLAIGNPNSYTLCGIISGHYTIPVDTYSTAKLKELEILVTPSDSAIDSLPDSIPALLIKSKQLKFAQNANLALVISIQTILEYIFHEFPVQTRN